ncbi:MAG: cyclic nucleotide-binding domain-containing protein [Magnetospirillum sp. WYHS-4]
MKTQLPPGTITLGGSIGVGPSYEERLRVNDLLVGLEDAPFGRFVQRCVFMAFDESEMIISEGEFAYSVFFVIEGRVRIASQVGGEGPEMEMVYRDVPAGRWFGEIAAIDKGERSATAYALDKQVVVAAAPREVFVNLILEHRHIAVRVLESLAAAIRSSNQRMAQVGSLSGVQRVYGYLLEASQPSPEPDGSWLIPKLPSHDEVALKAVTSREVVARAISQLLQDGVAKRERGAFRILNRQKLQQLAIQV